MMDNKSERLSDMKAFVSKAFDIKDEIEVLVVLACTKTGGYAEVSGDDVNRVARELHSLNVRIIKEVMSKEMEDVVVQ